MDYSGQVTPAMLVDGGMPTAVITPWALRTRPLYFRLFRLPGLALVVNDHVGPSVDPIAFFAVTFHV